MAITEAELSKIEDLIRERPDGVAIRDLAGAEATEAQRRAFHRRLKKLIDSGRVGITGNGNQVRYFPADREAPNPTTLLHKEDAHREAEGGLFIPISESGRLIQKNVRRPVSRRTPVGYTREFLSNYRPNTTFYLSPREREYLAKEGASDAGVKPAGAYAREIYSRLLIDLSYYSSRLEGNEYSLLETHDLIELGKRASGKSAEDAQMILNHKQAIEFIVDAADDIGFNTYTILNLHALLSDDLLPDERASGRLRQGIVGIGGSVFSPLETPAVIAECFGELLAKAREITDPFEQSFFVSVQLPYLQPFQDVNKRVSRFAANIPFIKRNLNPLTFLDVPEAMYKDGLLGIYELNRTELARDIYVWAYERSARRYGAAKQSLGAPDQFRLRYREAIRQVISTIIQAKLDRQSASKTISEYASAEMPAQDRDRFSEIVSAELIGIHEGNMARYRVRPSEYFAWKSVWEGGS